MHTGSAQKLTVTKSPFSIATQVETGGTCQAEIYVNLTQVRAEVFVSMHRVQAKLMGICIHHLRKPFGVKLGIVS